MQSLNSTSYMRKALMVAGMGMFTAFLFLVPLTSFAQSPSITVSAPTAGTAVPANSTITITGSVSPAPTISGTYIGYSLLEPNGQTATAGELSVATSTGDFSGSIVTGGPNFVTAGSYTLDFNYNGATTSVSLIYGNVTTSVPSATGTTTTVVVQSTVTVSSVVTQATTIVQSAVTTVSAVTATTVTQAFSTTTTVSATNGGAGTAEAIGAIGIIIAIVAIILAALAMRKK